MAVLQRDEQEFAQRIDVGIVGGGACGLTAATAAAERGASVLVLEQDDRLAGSTAMSLGAMCAAASGEHRQHGIADSPAAFIADVMAKTDGRADAALTHAIAHASGPAVDWLTHSHDVALRLDFKWTSLGHTYPRLHMTPGRHGAELLALLERAARNAGAEIVLRARVADIYVDASGRISGLGIARPDGSRELLGVGALVLANCGYGGNADLIAQHIPEMAGSKYFGHEGNRGDALLWGEALGAATADLTAYQGLGTLADPQAVVVPHPLILEGGWMVNTLGERFTHENANISGLCVPVNRQPDSRAWVIFDELRHRACLTHSVEQRELEAIGAIKRGATLAELANKCGLPVAALQREFAAIAAVRDRGESDRFGRRFDGIAPLAPEFCAIRVTGALFHTQGGLLVDKHARVQRANGGAFRNLFAGGGAARGISGPAVTGYLPGAGLCMAITLGHLAGAAAADIRHD